MIFVFRDSLSFDHSSLVVGWSTTVFSSGNIFGDIHLRSSIEHLSVGQVKMHSCLVSQQLKYYFPHSAYNKVSIGIKNFTIK